MIALVIDDSYLSRSLLCKVLEQNTDFEINNADGGNAGIELYEKLNPDIVFVDLLMPEVLGSDVIKHIRKKDQTCYIAVVSSDIQEFTRHEVIDLGADIFLSKPITEAKLKSAMDQFRNKIDTNNPIS